MGSEVIEIPVELFNHLPFIIINSSGTIISINRNRSIPLFLSLGENVFELIPELNGNDAASRVSTISVHLGGTSYLIHCFPVQKEGKIIIQFEMISEISILSALVENPYEGFIFVDKDGIIRVINETLAHYLKVPKNQLIGHHFDEFRIDRDLHRIIETKKPDLLNVFLAMGKNGIASRHPVFSDGEFLGVYGRYFSIDGRDLKDNTFGEDYINLLDGLQVNNIAQAMVELNAYKHEFYERNTSLFGIEKIIGHHPYIKELKEKILMVSDSPSSILLTGESGTGKELFAQAIHFHSNRSNYPYVKVNCAAIPENLLESELFGYVEGAFTGALKRGKMGKFELANKGIIFLDEIGDMPMAMQAKLLRVLQEKEIERLGSENTIPIDVRVISATNKDLHSMTINGSFRADLYYRLNVINFHIPALRERKDDIPELIEFFIKDLNQKLNRNIKEISTEAMHRMVSYDWPGNIRELINVLETSLNFCEDNVLSVKYLPYFFHTNYSSNTNEEDLQTTMENVQKSEIIAALEISGGKRKAAAETSDKFV